MSVNRKSEIGMLKNTACGEQKRGENQGLEEVIKGGNMEHRSRFLENENFRKQQTTGIKWITKLGGSWEQDILSRNAFKDL